jgi:hypothetical protein
LRKLAEGESVRVEGPGVLALDGDREWQLEAGQGATVTLRRDGPRVIDVERALTLSAHGAAFFDRGHWHDPHDAKVDCC